MKTGMQRVKESMDRAKARSAQFSGGSLNYFNWKDGDSKVVRFLTDDVVTCNFYEFVQTPSGKSQNFIIPSSLNEDGSGEDWVLKFGGKTISKEADTKGQLVDPLPRERTVGVAVLREETSDGIEDYLHEIEIDGKKYPSRWFGVVRQAHKNFWQTLVGYYGHYGTICDRDYLIKREGSTIDTSYSIIPLKEDPGWKGDESLTELQKFYGYGQPWDKEDPERFLSCPQTLDQWVEYFAGEERAKFWLTSSEAEAATNGKSAATTSSGTDEFHPATTHNAEPDPEAAPPPSTSDFASLRSQLKKRAAAQR